jgi:hypothetical protein
LLVLACRGAAAWVWLAVVELVLALAGAGTWAWLAVGWLRAVMPWRVGVDLGEVSVSALVWVEAFAGAGEPTSVRLVACRLAAGTAAWLGCVELELAGEAVRGWLGASRTDAGAVPWLVEAPLARWLLLLPALPGLPVLLSEAVLPTAFEAPIAPCAPAFSLLDRALSVLALLPAMLLPPPAFPLAFLPLLPALDLPLVSPALLLS